MSMRTHLRGPGYHRALMEMRRLAADERRIAAERSKQEIPRIMSTVSAEEIQRDQLALDINPGDNRSAAEAPTATPTPHKTPFVLRVAIQARIEKDEQRKSANAAARRQREQQRADSHIEPIFPLTVKDYEECRRVAEKDEMEEPYKGMFLGIIDDLETNGCSPRQKNKHVILLLSSCLLETSTPAQALINAGADIDGALSLNEIKSFCREFDEELPDDNDIDDTTRITPLLIACLDNNKNLIQTLLKANADTSVITEDMREDLVRTDSGREIVQLLIAAEAQKQVGPQRKNPGTFIPGLSQN